MKSSTLRPGKTPSYVTKLRQAAMRELDGPGENEVVKASPEFEVTHKRTPDNDTAAEDFDAENGVARYPGQNVPHIGNGSGGVR